MKRFDGIIVTSAVGVAPFTGAWIETPIAPASTPALAVAPFTGAWIETEVA